MTEKDHNCPHCDAKMERWRPPEGSTWGMSIQFVCFNDECDYYKNGWKWMSEKYGVVASYRHRLDPRTGQSGPLPVWSPDAHRDAIVKNGR